MTKKKLLLISIIGSLLFWIAMDPVIFGICGKYNYDCRKSADFFQQLLGVFPVVFLFSLITYKLPEEVFQYWWRFARWFVLVIVVATYILQNSGGGGELGMNKDFAFFILFILYSAFILVSGVKIYVSAKKSRGTLV